jgi:polyferredoxin
MSPQGIQRLRRVAQVTVFLAFVAIFAYANAQRPQRFWADLFSRLDPLLMLSASLASRTLVSGLALSSILVVISLTFGRAWCGWLCPMGSLLEWLGPRKPRAGVPPERFRTVKHLFLGLVLSGSLFAFQALIVLDPLTILNRAFAVTVWPALKSLMFGIEDVLYRWPALWSLLDAIHASIIHPVLLEGTPVYAWAFPTALILALLVAANWWAQRFWCRYLCPLGSLLGLLAKVSLFRREVRDGCSLCRRCEHTCPTGTIDADDSFRSDPAECIACYSCVTECEQRSVGFAWQFSGWRPARGRAYDPGRRQVLAVAAAAAAGAVLADVEPIAARKPATMIRPPGTAATDFSSLCIRCGACVRVCPTHGLQPSLLEGGIQNLMTPRLVPRLGYCSFGCHACSEVCPTGAVPRLALEDKQATAIGLAAINENRCLPWAYQTPCIVCEEACPVADKAIELEEAHEVDHTGAEVTLQRPRVIRELCIGCGICEYQCPVGGEAAIRVFAPTLLAGG